ncbi:MAG TPA: bifunctional precorrin-2 dehydrogenase/sirohydrochlorin ferrochelatase [Acidimicrobiales bacterium]|nr:bifunctional precorrin-2 dehydrogenase/sirohydrochlorin ferrochelatase [Acidimicrobiales bacterium]
MPPLVPGYPVTLMVEGRHCLVVGGGPVAARKAQGLAGAGALVTVVARRCCPEVRALADKAAASPFGRVTLEERPYRAGEASTYRLVVTATGDPEVDGAVAADAEAADVWVNSADDLAHCSFTLPSVHRDGPVSIAVSTAGTSPALAVWLRRRAASALGTELGLLAALLEEARQAVRAEGRPTNSVDWDAVLSGPLPDLVAAGRIDEARALLGAAITQGVGAAASPEPTR